MATANQGDRVDKAVLFACVALNLLNLALLLGRKPQATVWPLAPAPQPLPPCTHPGCSHERLPLRLCPKGHPMRPGFRPRGRPPGSRNAPPPPYVPSPLPTDD